MENLAARIMRVFATALGLDEHFFDSYVDAPISALRALNYPAAACCTTAGPMRAGAHTDYGSLTILLPQPGSEGPGDHRAGRPMDAGATDTRRFCHQYR